MVNLNASDFLNIINLIKRNAIDVTHNMLEKVNNINLTDNELNSLKKFYDRFHIDEQEKVLDEINNYIFNKKGGFNLEEIQLEEILSSTVKPTQSIVASEQPIKLVQPKLKPLATVPQIEKTQQIMYPHVKKKFLELTPEEQEARIKTVENFNKYQNLLKSKGNIAKIETKPEEYIGTKPTKKIYQQEEYIRTQPTRLNQPKSSGQAFAQLGILSGITALSQLAQTQKSNYQIPMVYSKTYQPNEYNPYQENLSQDQIEQLGYLLGSLGLFSGQALYSKGKQLFGKKNITAQIAGATSSIELNKDQIKLLETIIESSVKNKLIDQSQIESMKKILINGIQSGIIVLPETISSSTNKPLEQKTELISTPSITEQKPELISTPSITEQKPEFLPVPTIPEQKTELISVPIEEKLIETQTLQEPKKILPINISIPDKKEDQDLLKLEISFETIDSPQNTEINSASSESPYYL
ncbi:Hypothetical protein KVN_LOCUS416 [uncultured virus]|nr:Hypothetical protein KVN_LOCUS416 [uncultured virus]